MKKRLFIIAAVCVMVLCLVLACACNPSDNPDGSEPGGPTDPTDPAPTARQVYFQVAEGEPQLMQGSLDGATEVYTITVVLSVGARVAIYDQDYVIYSNYDGQFDGTATVAGQYVFTLKINDGAGVVYVNLPQADPGQDDPDQKDPDDPTDPDEPAKPTPKDTKVTVYYSNSLRWSNVYAYIWNYKTNTPKATWPGTKLTVSGTSGMGEKQYSVQLDYTQYDRIIFNNGAGQQTKDLIVGAAASGYYGEDGIFTMNESNYGKVQYVTLKDTKNLTYISGNSKKVSIYTPNGYSTSKKYGVLYMFDSQNLYESATGVDKSKSSYDTWMVDVAVTSLMKNGHDGIIIVAIDNSDGHRDQELTMSQSFGNLTSLAYSPSFYNGKLDELGNFMKETVMPYVEQHYSVDTSREHTGIAGSSSGGLAAYYLGLRDNDLYGYIGAFSPANGLFATKDWTKFYAGKDFSKGRPTIYAYCGQNDRDEDMLLPATKEIKNLTAYGFAPDSIIENYVTGGTHNEVYWRIAFVDFIGKMLG